MADADVLLADAVAASASFPPLLCPAIVHLKDPEFSAAELTA